MMIVIILGTLFAVTVAIAVGNNMGVISGPTAGSRIVKRGTLSLLAVAGLLSGYFLEGWKLRTEYSNISALYSIVSILLAMVILALLTVGGFITSITQIFVGIYIGVLLLQGSSYGILIVGKIIGYWLITFILSVATSYIFMKVLGGRKSNALINNLLTLKIVSIILVFLTAYMLGANTIGFMTSFIPTTVPSTITNILVVVGIVAGIVVVRGGKGIAKLGSGFYGIRYSSSVIPYISTLLLTEIGTQLSIPLPMSISIFSGVLGAAVGMKLRLINPRDVSIYIIISWIIPLLISIIASYVIFSFLRMPSYHM